MTKRQQKLLKNISLQAINLDWNIAFAGKSKGNRHLFRVNEIAQFLFENEGGDKFITLASAWVHDVTLAEKLDDNPKKISTATQKFLDQFKDLKTEEKLAIVACVATHESGGGVSIESRIVHDADVIDKSGMLGVIRHIWKMTNMIHNRIVKTEKDLDELREHLLFRSSKISTKTAKPLIEFLNSSQNEFFKYKHCKQIFENISKLSSEGMISDNIALQLISQYKSLSFINLLKKQLEVSYLEEVK